VSRNPQRVPSAVHPPSQSQVTGPFIAGPVIASTAGRTAWPAAGLVRAAL